MTPHLVLGFAMGIFLSITVLLLSIFIGIRKKDNDEIKVGDIYISKIRFNDPFQDNSNIKLHKKIIEIKSQNGDKYVKFSTYYGDDSEKLSYFLDFNTKYIKDE